jgi:hypothetical protein
LASDSQEKYKIRGGINKLKYNPANSPVWNSLIKIKELYLAGRKVVIGNGKDTDFWRDPANSPLLNFRSEFKLL